MLKQFCFILLMTLSTRNLQAQKQMKLDDSLALYSDVYEAKMQSHKGSLSLTPFLFADYQILDLKNQWTSSSYWAVYLKDKYIRRETKTNRTSFSFGFTSPFADTATVAVLFQKDKPGNLLLTSRKLDANERNYNEPMDAFTAYIKLNKEEKPWQLLFQLDKNGWTWNRKYRGILTNGEETIDLLSIDRWSDGKKPMITGLFDLGTEFYTGEKSIAALQYPVLKSPKIWFSTKLNKDRKFLLAAAIETLLIACSDNTNNDQMIKD